MRSLVLAFLLLGCRGQAASPAPVPSSALTASATRAIPSATTPPVTPVTYDTSCQHDWDCTPAPTCCPTPCTEDVINVKDSARASADLQCDPAQPCISAGGCRTFKYLCVEHHCKISFAGDQDFRERESEPAMGAK